MASKLRFLVRRLTWAGREVTFALVQLLRRIVPGHADRHHHARLLLARRVGSETATLDGRSDAVAVAPGTVCLGTPDSDTLVAVSPPAAKNLR